MDMKRIQICLTPETFNKINDERGDVPLSIFLRKRIEKEFEI